MSATTARRFEDLPEAAVLTAAAAPVPTDWAMAELTRHWGLTGTLQPLSGERDANFRLDAADGTRWLFKASHPIEPAEVTDYQTQALAHLARTAPQLPVQRLRPTRAGALSVSAAAPDGPSGGPRVLRLIGWLDGLPAPQAPRSAAQRDSVARTLARLDRALAGLRHPAEQRQLPWDLQRADAIDTLLDHVPDPQRRTLARQALAGFAEQVRPRLAALPRQPIHNDFNLYNLLVDPQQPEQVSAVLDFGDMLAAPRVCDLAVAAAYQVGSGVDAGAGAGVEPGADALTSVAAFAASYHAEAPLSARELDLLWPLVLARLVLVVAISGWRAARQPEHADYLLRNNAISWQRLQACAPLDAARVRAALAEACGV